MILAEELRKSYGEHVAVDGLSFQILKGETLGLLGPNGAGKTTTISMLIGLLKPDSGRVSIGDSDQSPNSSKSNPITPAVRRMIGVAPQSLSLYDELTAHENLKFFGRLYGYSGSRLKKRIDWALDFSELQDRKNDLVSQYSGGMKRRLNIAAALIHEPRILLLDEPTVGVDPQSRNHIFESIENLKQDGLTIIYTTHYMEEAQRLCDRVAIVDHGKLLDIGTTRELLERHGGDSLVTAELIPSLDLLGNEDSLPGKLEGLNLRFQSSHPVEDIAKMSKDGIEFQNLQISQPNLEDVFLKLTGRSLRD